MNKLLDSAGEGDLEETIERVLERVITSGQGSYLDFDDKMQKGFDDGTFGADDELTRALATVSADSHDIMYAIACDPSIMKKLRGMGPVEAVAWVLRNLEKLQQGIDLGNSSQEGYERHRKKRGARY